MNSMDNIGNQCYRYGNTSLNLISLPIKRSTRLDVLGTTRSFVLHERSLDKA
jgi:hypothetical protein